MIVEFAKQIKKEFLNYPLSDRIKIMEFSTHVEQYGLEGLAGRNKFSDDVPTDDPNWKDKVAYAQEHNLWHYHIGIPNYEQSSKGDLVSEYILHYIRNDEENWIKIVDMSAHPPFSLPSEDYLQ